MRFVKGLFLTACMTFVWGLGVLGIIAVAISFPVITKWVILITVIIWFVRISDIYDNK